jgi:uncharacterized protein YdaT
MKYVGKYRYYAEDINKVGNNFNSPEEAYNEAKKDLSKLGYEVTKLDDNLEFDYISKSTGVSYEGNIGIMYDETKLEDGWVFEIEDDGRRVIYKEDEIYGNVVVSKLTDGYYEFEDDEGGYPEVFPNIRKLTIKKRLNIPNSVIKQLEGDIVESKTKRLTKQLKSILEDVREWEHNGHRFKEITVDSKEVEVIPGLTIKFNKVEHGQDDVYTRTTWELDKSVNLNAANQAITKHIIDQLGLDDYRIGGWSGAIPLSITTEED